MTLLRHTWGHLGAPATLSAPEWEVLLALTDREDLSAALGARVKERGVPVPAGVARRLREAYLASAARNIRLFHELDQVLDALRAAGVEVVLLKGAHLAAAVYGDIALRAMADMDPWIPGQQLEAAKAALRSMGYCRHANQERPPDLQDTLLGETQMAKPGAPHFELHRKVFAGEWLRHAADVDERGIWDRCRAVEGGAVRQMSPEDTVVHLCVHLAVNHQMSGRAIRTLADLDYARRTWSVDWKTVGDRALAWRVSGATWIVLQALADLFGDAEGALPLRALAPWWVRRRILRRFAPLHVLASGHALSSGRWRYVFLLALVDRPSDAIRLIWRAVFPDRRRLTLRYDAPDPRSWRVWQLRAKHVFDAATRGTF